MCSEVGFLDPFLRSLMIFFRFKNALQVNTPVIQSGFQSKIQKWSASTLDIYHLYCAKERQRFF